MKRDRDLTPPGCRPTLDRQIDPCDVGRPIGGEEGGHFDHFFGPAPALEERAV